MTSQKRKQLTAMLQGAGMVIDLAGLSCQTRLTFERRTMRHDAAALRRDLDAVCGDLARAFSIARDASGLG